MPEQTVTQDQWTPPAGQEWRRELPKDLRDKPEADIVKWGLNAHQQMGALNNDLGTYKKQIDEWAGKHQQATSGLQQYQQAVQQWNDWHKKEVEPHWPEFLKWREQGANGGGDRGRQATASGEIPDDVLQDWANLTPDKQARTLAELVAKQVGTSNADYQKQLQASYAEQVKALNQLIKEKELYFQNYLKVWQKAFEEKQRNPSLDIDKAVQQALDVFSGKVDPLELGIRLSTFDQDKQAFVSDQRKLWEAEQAEKDKQKQMLPPLSSGTPPIYKAPTGPPRGLGSMKQEVAQALAEKFGTQIF